MDLPDGTQQVADVVGQPVHQHCERHGDAGEDVHDREHPQHHLLHHFSLLVRSALGHVALHAVVLHEPQAEAHQRHEDADDDLAVDVGGGEVLGHVHAKHVGGGELLGGGDVEGAEAGTVPEFATGDVWNGRQGVEHAHEHRTLHEHRQHRRAAAHRVRVVVLVELHHLALQSLFAGGIVLALVLVLDALHLGLQNGHLGLHLAHALHGLVEQREHARLDHNHQEHDGHDPRETDLVHAQHHHESVESGHNLRHEPLDGVQELVQPAPETTIEEELILIHYRPFSLSPIGSSTSRGVRRGSSCAFDHEHL